MLSLEQLHTDNANDHDTNDDDDNNNTQWTNHDCTGSLACMPNEPKSNGVYCLQINPFCELKCPLLACLFA